jgi:hypothetical protein
MGKRCPPSSKPWGMGIAMFVLRRVGRWVQIGDRQAVPPLIQALGYEMFVRRRVGRWV